MEQFYAIDFSQEQLPALMLVKSSEKAVEFYEYPEDVNEDDLAGWIFEKVFSDLLTLRTT